MGLFIALAIAAAVGAAVWVANRVGWIDLSDKSGSGSGSGGGSGSGMGGGFGGGFGAIDEVFHPQAYEVQLLRDREVSLPAPAPVAGDDDFGIFHGERPKTVHIELDEFGRPVAPRR